MTHYRHDLHQKSKALRAHMTKEERLLWYRFLHDYPIRFRRQKPLANYIVDFYCAKARLAVELDGSQHYDERGLQYDAERTKVLEGLGIYVLRFTNLDVHRNFRAVCERIIQVVEERCGHLPQT